MTQILISTDGKNNSGDASWENAEIVIDPYAFVRVQDVLNASSAKSGAQLLTVDSYLRVAANIAGQSDVIVLAVQSLDNTSDCVGALTYRETY